MPPRKPKALLVIAHGIGEHSGRYADVADYFTKRDLAVWACDHRGHGKSNGKRGHIDNFDDYLADLGQMIRIAKDHYPGIKTFLMGQSLGGLIATFYAEKHSRELDGLIASGPALREKMKISPVKAFMGRTLSSIMPSFSTSTGLDPNLLSHDQEVVKKYVEDPLVHKVATARWFTEYRRAQEETMRLADKLTLPCLIIQGGADEIVDPAVATELYRKVKSSDKTLKVYDGFYHESLNEVGKESVLGDISTWLFARI
jgi:alpha-beta hydrolase superfamily lysophospholipase